MVVVVVAVVPDSHGCVVVRVVVVVGVVVGVVSIVHRNHRTNQTILEQLPAISLSYVEIVQQHQ